RRVLFRSDRSLGACRHLWGACGRHLLRDRPDRRQDRQCCTCEGARKAAARGGGERRGCGRGLALILEPAFPLAIEQWVAGDVVLDNVADCDRCREGKDAIASPSAPGGEGVILCGGCHSL